MTDFRSIRWPPKKNYYYFTTTIEQYVAKNHAFNKV